MSDSQEWRLAADIESEADGALDRLVALTDQTNGDAFFELPEDIVLTHDGDRLFVYAGSRAGIDAVRAIIEGPFASEIVTARIVITCWDDETGVWQQIDPPPSEEELRAAADELQRAQQTETQTFVCKVGRGVRRDLEESMLDWANRLGLRCEFVEHKHFMTTQIAFTVTGPHHRVEEFRDGLRAESVSTMRSGALLGLEPL
jgi:hypothetical protein